MLAGDHQNSLYRACRALLLINSISEGALKATQAALEMGKGQAYISVFVPRTSPDVFPSFPVLIAWFAGNYLPFDFGLWEPGLWARSLGTAHGFLPGRGIGLSE